MKEKIATVVGIILVILGTIIGVATGYVAADITGLAIALLGAGAVAYGMWKNRNKEKPAWLSILSIVLICAGAFIAGFTGFAEEAMISIVGAVVSIVLVIIGLITNAVAHKEVKKVEAKK